ATTAVTADMALITPIGLDHEAWLGNTILQVAQEKSYALKGCRWALSVAQNSAVENILEQQHHQLCYSPSFQQDCLMPGEHQKINAGLAYSALQVLRSAGYINCSLKKLKRAVSTAVAPGRLQYIAHHQAHIWLDAAHNRHAVEALLPSLTSLADPFDAILIYTREDRSLIDCHALLSPYAKQLISDDTYPSPTQALKAILQTQPKARILLLGSFLSVAEAWHYLQATQ
ncbi:MAG: bifunctional folylpolyglutamate synthase/dihydrofolate synthase, partial [Mariprofundaceae bacterium]